MTTSRARQARLLRQSALVCTGTRLCGSASTRSTSTARPPPPSSPATPCPRGGRRTAHELDLASRSLSAEMGPAFRPCVRSLFVWPRRRARAPQGASVPGARRPHQHHDRLVLLGRGGGAVRGCTALAVHCQLCRGTGRLSARRQCQPTTANGTIWGERHRVHCRGVIRQWGTGGFYYNSRGPPYLPQVKAVRDNIEATCKNTSTRVYGVPRVHIARAVSVVRGSYFLQNARRSARDHGQGSRGGGRRGRAHLPGQCRPRGGRGVGGQAELAAWAFRSAAPCGFPVESEGTTALPIISMKCDFLFLLRFQIAAVALPLQRKETIT